MALRLLLLATMLLSTCAADDWGSAQFLIGHWTGEGGGGPGQGSGSFSFTPDLQGKVLLRRNVSVYPAANGKPAFRHDDLMVVYREGGQMKAMYFDSEEHAIAYAVTPAGGGAVFTSEGPPGVPRYRLTYASTGRDTLKIKFEIAAPGKDFATYIEASAHKDQ